MIQTTNIAECKVRFNVVFVIVVFVVFIVSLCQTEGGGQCILVFEGLTKVSDWCLEGRVCFGVNLYLPFTLLILK